MNTTSRLFAIVSLLSFTSAPCMAADAAPRALTCAVTVDYVLTAQDGEVIDTETYHNAFIVAPGADFQDDFSTPTRTKLFTASMQQGENRAVVTITYFNDVSTFNSVEFNAQMAILNGQTAETTSGSQTFSTSTAPLSGHYTTSYELSCRR
jgi:hypothetical protein